MSVSRGVGGTQLESRKMSIGIRFISLTAIASAALLAVIFLLSSHQTDGNLGFSLTTSSGPQRLRIVYLAHGDGHEIATVGTRKQRRWDPYVNLVLRTLHLPCRRGTLSSLSVDFRDGAYGLGLFVSMDGFLNPVAPREDLLVHFIDATGMRHPMRFSESVSSLDLRTHLAAWRLEMPTRPDPGSRIEIVHSSTRKRLAEVRELTPR